MNCRSFLLVFLHVTRTQGITFAHSLATEGLAKVFACMQRKEKLCVLLPNLDNENAPEKILGDGFIYMKPDTPNSERMPEDAKGGDRTQC